MKVNLKPASIIYPQPVLVIGTYEKKEVPNVMVAAWGGIYDTNQIGFMLDHRHMTTDNIRQGSDFTVSMATVSTMGESDYFGMVSAHHRPGKIENVGFHAAPSQHVHAPVIEEYPLTFECKVSHIAQVGEDFHIIGDIVNILVDENILDAHGKIDPAKLNPIIFDAVHSTYIELGRTVGKAWSEGKLFNHS